MASGKDRFIDGQIYEESINHHYPLQSPFSLSFAKTRTSARSKSANELVRVVLPLFFEFSLNFLRNFYESSWSPLTSLAPEPR